MNNTDTWIEMVCWDCVMWLANRDDSGASTQWDKEALLATMATRHMVVLGGDRQFSPRPCYGCDTTLAGDRVAVIVEEN